MHRNYLLDSILLLISLILAVTGGILWGCTRRRCVEAGRRVSAEDSVQASRLLHRCTSLAFLASLLLHLAWHWKWIREYTPIVFHGEVAEGNG